MTALATVAGVLLILFVFVEAFEALVLPRRVTRPYRFSRLYLPDRVVDLESSDRAVVPASCHAANRRS